MPRQKGKGARNTAQKIRAVKIGKSKLLSAPPRRIGAAVPTPVRRSGRAAFSTDVFAFDKHDGLSDKHRAPQPRVKSSMYYEEHSAWNPARAKSDGKWHAAVVAYSNEPSVWLVCWTDTPNKLDTFTKIKFGPDVEVRFARSNTIRILTTDFDFAAL